MRFNGWMDYLGGIVSVKIRGEYPERLINLALSRGIFMGGIKRDGSDITFRLRRNGVGPLQAIAEQLDYEVEITGRRGLPFYRRVFKERLMMFGGAVLFLTILYILTSFVWFMDIAGTSQVDQKQIMDSAERHGLHKWTWKNGFDKTGVEQGILKDLPQLSYVEINIRGIKANIKVVEKVLPDESQMSACNIVASAGGIIEDILVLEGAAAVKKGDPVAEGDILISGIVERFIDPAQIEISGQTQNETASPPRLVRARGTVKARVLYEGYGEQTLEIRKRVFTGREEGKLVLMSPWGQMVVAKPHRQFKQYIVRNEPKTLNSPWGKIGWTQKKWLEFRVVAREVDSEWALEKAKERAIINLRDCMGNSEKIVDTKIRIVSSPSDTIIRVKASAEVVQDIGRPEPLNMEENVQ